MVTTATRDSAAVQSISPKKIPPIKIWATVGAVLLTAWVLIVAKWVTGPYFKTVPQGPSDPPAWMKAELQVFQFGGAIAAAAIFYFLLIRPWRRDRSVTIDGILSLVVLLLSVYDPLSNYFGHWFTYNAYMLNFGSIMGELPGVLSHHEPGATQAWPIIVLPTAYVYVFAALLAMGRWFMNRVRARRPEMSSLALVACAFLFFVAVDVILEGIFFMPLGLWAYAGGHGRLLGEGNYWTLPVQEVLAFSMVFTGVTAIRYFVDDRGRTFAERGVDELAVSSRKRTGLRFLAVFGAVNLWLVVAYHLPNGLLALQANNWPTDVQNRSYLTNQICGQGTDRACPGPDVPIARPGSIHVGPSGEVVEPPGYRPRTVVPFALR